MNLILKLIISSFAVVITSFILPGIHLKNYLAAIVVAFVIGILNILVKPLLIILTIPVTILTFGLFLLVINAIIILIAGAMVPGFAVDGFWWALLFSLILSFISYLLGINRINKN